MSAQRARSPAGEMETLSGEMETLRGVLHQRLAAAVDDILGEFGRTVARYRDQIDLQRRQLDGLKAEERARSRSAGTALILIWTDINVDYLMFHII